MIIRFILKEQIGFALFFIAPKAPEPRDWRIFFVQAGICFLTTEYSSSGML